jgi:hypothetical protein
MTEIELAWAAGFFDGEGSVRIDKARGGAPTGRLTVEISQIDRAPLDALRAKWGGIVRPVGGVHLRAAWKWQVVSRQALAFLGAIAPYIRLERNRQRIMLAREFQEGAGARGVVGDDEYLAWRFGCYLRMRALNARGLA